MGLPRSHVSTSSHVGVSGGYHVPVGGGPARTPVGGGRSAHMGGRRVYVGRGMPVVRPSVHISSPPIIVSSPRTRTHVWVASPPTMTIRGKNACISLGSIALITGVALLALGIVFLNPIAMGFGVMGIVGGAISTGVGGAARLRII